MLVKLSGDKYINSEAIACIEPLSFQTAESKLLWIVRLNGDGLSMKLTQKQFGELMDCLPTCSPYAANSAPEGEAQ